MLMPIIIINALLTARPDEHEMIREAAEEELQHCFRRACEAL